MSDYLSQAAQRASRSPGVIRPLLPSRFDLEKSADTTALTSPEIEEHLQTESPRRERERTADEITAPEEQMIPTATTRAAASMLTGESTPTAKQPPVAATPPERGAPSAPSQTVSKKPASKEPAIARAPTDQSQPVTEPDVESRPAPAPPQVEVHPPVLERPKKDLPAPIIAAPVARRREARLVGTQAQKSVASADRELSAGPKIQVTIGRLEVRAVQSAPAPPAPAPPSPRVSLDEYLRSRNGGAA